MDTLLLDGFEKEILQTRQELDDLLSTEGVDQAAAAVLSDIAQTRGKMLRPILVLLSARCGSGEGLSKRLCRLAALVEMVHMASLIHDDIVDDAPLRRGMPTAQSKYGKDAAVYAGDLILSRIVSTLFREHYEPVGAFFGQTVEDMCFGELVQYSARFRTDTTVEKYLRCIYGKTASLCTLACRCGAVLGGCGRETEEHLTEAGSSLGYLFQIRDDFLDFTQTADRAGKPTHADFREGILTLPVLYAMEEPAAREEITRLAGIASRGQMTSAHNARLGQIIRETGGMDRALKTMLRYADKGLAAVDRLPDPQARSAFRTIFARLTQISGFAG